MKKITNKNKCYGCTSCVNICPKRAISMQEDENGFKYPRIDHSKCIDCGLCSNVCPANKSVGKNECLNVYAVKHKEPKVREASTSGGVFTALSDYILDKNGVVYGTELDKNMKVSYRRVTTKKERNNLRGSKYVQSDLKDAFSKIKIDIEDEKMVLFVGNPCYIAGLKSFLRNHDYPNLILCDIICHGVPSPLIFNEHIKLINSKGKIKKYLFRDKKIGWRGPNVTIGYGNKEESNTEFANIFSDLYFGGYISRENCSNCEYASTKRVSDITIGDFWGIEKVLPDFNDEKGVNLVMINSEKGKKFFSNVLNDLEYRESNLSDCLQPQLQYPAKQNIHRNYFFKDFHTKGFNYVAKKYTSYGLKNRVLRSIKKMIPNFIKERLKGK